jgi:hypothetical protein
MPKQSSSIQVNQYVFDLLKRQYQVRYGFSPKQLIEALNKKYSDKRFENKNGDIDNVISDKTIRNFFSARIYTDAPSMREANLNYLCGVLLDGASYRDVVEAENSGKHVSQHLNFDLDVSNIHDYSAHLHKVCNSIKVLTMPEPVALDKLYSKVLPVKKTSTQDFHRQLIHSWLEKPSDEQERDLACSEYIVTPETVDIDDILESNRRVCIWGRAGGGKTTFLKYLALRTLRDFQGGSGSTIPVFIELKQINNFDQAQTVEIIDIIAKELALYIPSSQESIASIISQGKIMVLLDGLDEVNSPQLAKSCIAINEFSRKYPDCKIVITCRFNSCEHVFERFTDVQLPDFNSSQIQAFVGTWFSNDPQKAQKLLDKILESPAVSELSTNPLMLTMLCLTIREYGFPKHSYDLYADAVDLFLRKWDSTRLIERHQILNLSHRRKSDFLGNLAFEAYSVPSIKDSWRENELTSIAEKFIKNLNGKLPQQDLRDIAEDFVRSIQANHGLITLRDKGEYSFSHLTFQEFFVAQHIVESQDSTILEKAIKESLTNLNWREIFLMIVERIPNADRFLRALFYYTNKLAAEKSVQDMLKWLNRKTTDSGVGSSSWRAGYLAIDLELDFYIDNSIPIQRNLAYRLSRKLRQYNIERDRIVPRTERVQLDLHLGVILALSKDNGKSIKEFTEKSSDYAKEYLGLRSDFSIETLLNKAIIITRDLQGFGDLALELEELQSSIPLRDAKPSSWVNWSTRLSACMEKHLDIGFNKVFSDEDAKSIENYLYANNLLLDCIQSDIYCSSDIRDGIVDRMLLPNNYSPSTKDVLVFQSDYGT